MINLNVLTLLIFFIYFIANSFICGLLWKNYKNYKLLILTYLFGLIGVILIVIINPKFWNKKIPNNILNIIYKFIF